MNCSPAAALVSCEQRAAGVAAGPAAGVLAAALLLEVVAGVGWAVKLLPQAAGPASSTSAGGAEVVRLVRAGVWVSCFL